MLINNCPFLTSSRLFTVLLAIDLCIIKSKRYKMKRAITLITIAVSVSVFCIREKSRFASEKPIIKNVSLKVYKSNDYLSAIYNNATAKISVSITKVSNRSRTIIWNKTFDALQLKQYPSMEDSLLQKLVISDVYNEREHLEIVSTVSYYANGSLLEIREGLLLSKEAADGILSIPI